MMRICVGAPMSMTKPPMREGSTFCCRNSFSPFFSTPPSARKWEASAEPQFYARKTSAHQTALSKVTPRTSRNASSAQH